MAKDKILPIRNLAKERDMKRDNSPIANAIKERNEKKAKNTIAIAKKEYAEARAKNDYIGMRNANNKANKARDVLGIKHYDSSVGDKQYANTILKNKGYTAPSAVQPLALPPKTSTKPLNPKIDDVKTRHNKRTEGNPINQGYRIGMKNSPSVKSYINYNEGLAYGMNPFASKKSHIKDLEKTYGKDISDDIQKSKMYGLGKFVGTGLQYTAGYEMAGGKIAQGLLKVPNIARLGKLGQGIAKSAATDLTVGSALNANEVFRKEGLKGKEGLKAFGTQMGIDLALGTGFEALGHGLGKLANNRAERRVIGQTSPIQNNNPINLNDGDVQNYLNSGKKKTIEAKMKRMHDGAILTLRNQKEVNDYVVSSLQRVAKDDIRAYGKTNPRIIDEVHKLTNGEVNMTGSFLELDSGQIWHSYKNHHIPKEKGDIPLEIKDYFSIPQYVNNYDDILKMVPTKNGWRITLGKKINGHSIITEMYTEGRNSLRFYNMWGVTTEKYKNLLKNKRILINTRGAKTPNTQKGVSLLEDSNINIPPNETKVNKMGENSIGADRNRAMGYNEALETYGAFKQSKKPLSKANNTKVRDIKVPKGNPYGDVSQGARTFMESKTAVSYKILDEIKDELVKGKFNKVTKSNKVAMDNVRSTLDENGVDGTYKIFSANMKSGKQYTSEDIIMGIELEKELVKQGNNKEAIDVITDVIQMASEAGRTLQAMRLVKNLSPDGRLLRIKKLKWKLEKNSQITLDFPKAFEDKILNAQNAKEIFEAEEAAKIHLWNQVPNNFFEKANAFRFLAMLGNPKTHFRNMIGNAVFSPTRNLKNAISAGLERLYFGKGAKNVRTKTFVSKKDDEAIIKFANESFDEMKNTLLNGSKYFDTRRPIESKVFETKWLEGLRKFNNNMLEAEDAIFLKKAYVDSLAQYIKINKLPINKVLNSKESQKQFALQMEAAKNYASKEALKATYRDFSAMANALTKFRNNLGDSDKMALRATGLMMDGAVPFVKTPINILKRGVEYSPVSLANSLKQIFIDVPKGNATATEAIDNMAKGIVGSGIVALGAFLNHLSVIDGNLNDKNAMERELNKMSGRQSYSLNIGGISFSIDWLAPISIPLFVGVELNEAFEKEGYSFTDIIDAMANIAEPIFSMSMLKGIDDAFKSGYSDNSGGALVNIAENAALGYAGQFNPTIFGQTARTADLTIRDTSSTQKGILKHLEQFGKRQVAKVPIASHFLQPKIDMFGEPIKNEFGYLGSAGQNFALPGYLKTKDDGKVANELIRMHELYGKEALPSEYPSEIKRNGESYRLTSRELMDYKIIRGKAIKEGIESMMSQEGYKSLPEDVKLKKLKEIYDIAKDTAKNEILSSRGYTDVWFDGISKEKIEGYQKFADKMTPKEYRERIKAGGKYKNKVAGAMNLIEKYEDTDRELLEALGYSRKSIVKASVINDLGLSAAEYSSLIKEAKKMNEKKGGLTQIAVAKYLQQNPDLTDTEKKALILTVIE